MAMFIIKRKTALFNKEGETPVGTIERTPAMSYKSFVAASFEMNEFQLQEFIKQALRRFTVGDSHHCYEIEIEAH